MEISSDPYEQKLYHMFKSHDTECLGTLDETSLMKLCSSLELNDQGNALINSLIRDSKSRVSFKAFKEALLAFLGTEMENVDKEKKSLFHDNFLHKAPDSPDREVSPKLVMGTKKYGRRSRPQSLVTDSSLSDSDTETVAVVPNLNNKTQKVQRSSSQSEIHGTRRRRPTSGTKLKRCASLPAQKNQRVREQLVKQQATSTQTTLTSSVESLGNLDFENLSHTLYEIWTNYGNELGTHYLNRTQLSIVCERVGLRRVAGKVAEEVFEKLKLKPKDTICFSNFLGLIQSDADNVSSVTTAEHTFSMSDDATIVQDSLCTLMDSTNDNELHAKDIPSQLETIPAHSIIEMWEAINISDAKGFLINLGFDDDEINISQLSKALEEELRGLNGESLTSLLKASLALRKAEVASLQQSLRQLVDENRKLHADNKEANKRAALLAQEIDERHANLEDSTKTEIRMLEQRHAEVIRELTSQLANDRENWSALNARLESRIKFLELDDARLKSDLSILQNENCALEKEQLSLQKQITDLLETNIKLNNEVVELEERQRNDDGQKGEKETEEVLELIEKITSLQVENANLRDKNDELVSEIEGISIELSRYKNRKIVVSRSNTETTTESLSDDPEQTSLGVKRRGDSPSKTRITEESPRLGKLRKCSNDNSESEASGDWVALNSELNANNDVVTPTTTSGFSQDFSSITDSKDEEIKNLKEKIAKLEKELIELKQVKFPNDSTKQDASGKNSENAKNEDRCLELENSLEQMRKAYEDCEDYWQSKLNEERQLFEKERQIYEDEQQESDKKFTELMEKVREYEEQYSKDGRLSPIEEKDTLEQQYIDLESEIEEIKHNTKKMLEEKTKDIEKLQSLVAELKSRLGESNDVCSNSVHLAPENSEIESPASSPISYLWNQSTIQAPARDYQNPNWKPKQDKRLDNLSTSETAIFSTTDVTKINDDKNDSPTILPIQKPISEKSRPENSRDSDETASNASAKSFETHSIASTHSIHKSSTIEESNCSSPNQMKEELKRLKLVEIQLKEQITDLAQKRDGLVMELQQLQEAKPVLEKAYARAAHPTLLQRVNMLEQKNRHLQTVLRQQQQYTETIMHQTWHQQRAEITELRNRLETQGIFMTEQAQRLGNADLLVKDLYVENSHLTATIQRLEQQRNRANLIHQHQGLNGVPGMP